MMPDLWPILAVISTFALVFACVVIRVQADEIRKLKRNGQ